MSVVGRGDRFAFGRTWLNNLILWYRFPRIFKLSRCQDSFISSVAASPFRYLLKSSPIRLLRDLSLPWVLLQSVVINPTTPDYRVGHKSGKFSGRSSVLIICFPNNSEKLMPQLSKSLWEAIGGVIIPMAIVPSNLLLVLVNTKIKLLATCYYILYCKGLWYELLQAVNIEWVFSLHCWIFFRQPLSSELSSLFLSP